MFHRLAEKAATVILRVGMTIALRRLVRISNLVSLLMFLMTAPLGMAGIVLSGGSLPMIFEGSFLVIFGLTQIAGIFFSRWYLLTRGDEITQMLTEDLTGWLKSRATYAAGWQNS